MQPSLDEKTLSTIELRLAGAQNAFADYYGGDSLVGRQPIHSVYGGAHLFKATTHRKLGQLALRNLETYAPNFAGLARALGLPGAAELPTSEAAVAALGQQMADAEGEPAAEPAPDPARLAYTIYHRVREKLRREPVEDYRIDFEDGYGYRADTEEDGHAAAAARQVAAGLAAGDLPPFIGIRPKSFSAEAYGRAIRTLDIFLTTLAGESGGRLPDNFIINLPKVTLAAQVEALVDVVAALETKHGFPPKSIRLDLMIETPQALINRRGEVALHRLVQAGRGRVTSVAFGTYDYTALCHIIAAYQRHTHAAADFARHIMQVSLAGTGITLSDGVTNVMPIARHRAEAGQTLTPEQRAANQAAVHQAWRLHYENVRHSLAHGYYQGWDLHPAQLPVRYAATYAFFLENLADASRRLRNFIEQAAQATLVGNTFDDAATGQGLLNFFLRGLACGAITEAEALATGITLEELHSRSFARIVANRTAQTDQKEKDV